MDWGALLDNPEAAAALKRMLGKSTEEAGQEMSPLFEQIQKRQDVAEALKGTPKDYPPINPKSAEESAKTFQSQLPPPEQPNFVLQGQPYSGKVPAIRQQGQVPAALERDVTPEVKAGDSGDSTPVSEVFDPTQDQSKAVSGEELPDEINQTPMSKNQKMALAGTGIAAGTGLAAYLGQKDEDQAPASEEQPPTSPAARHVASAEPKDETDEIGDELDQAQDEDFDLKNDKGGGGKKKAPETIEPKEAQMRQAISNILNFGGTNAGPNALDKAIAERREMLRQANMNEGFARIGAGIARVTPDLTQFEQQKKMAQMPLEEYALRQKYEENDPNSGISSGLRDYIAKLGVPVSDKATAAQIKQVLPMVWKDMEEKQAQAARHQDFLLRQQEMNLRHQELQFQKDQARQDKLAKQGQDQFNKGIQQAESVRGNRAIQNDMQTLQRVQNAKSIIAMYPNPNDIPPNMLATFDADMATIMMGGVPGEGVIHEVASPTIAKGFSKFMQKWSNQPVGARASAFVKQYGNYFDTLGRDAQERIDKRYQRIGNTMGMSWSPEQKEAFRQEYMPQHSLNSSGQFVVKHRTQYQPGSIVSVNGKPAKVGPDGDTLLDVMTGQPLKSE